MPNVTRLNHAVLYVSELDRSVEFYKKAFGFEEIDRMGEDASTYQKSSREPVELAPMMRIGAFLANAPMTPVAPAESPMSTAPEITACRVSPPPAV